MNNKCVKLLYESNHFSNIFGNTKLSINANIKDEKNVVSILNRNSHNFDPFTFNEDNGDIYIFSYRDYNHNFNNKIESNDDEKYIEVFIIKKDDYTKKNNSITINKITKNPKIKTKNTADCYVCDENDPIPIHISDVIYEISDRFCSFPIKMGTEYHYYKKTQSFNKKNPFALTMCDYEGDIIDNCIVDFFRDIRASRDMINNNRIDITQIEEEANIDSYNHHHFCSFLNFMHSINFIDLNKLDNYLDSVMEICGDDNTKNYKIDANIEKLISYLNKETTRTKWKHVIKVSNGGCDINSMYRSEKFIPLQKLAEFFDLQRHLDKDPVEYNTMESSTFIEFCLIVLGVKDYVLKTRS